MVARSATTPSGPAGPPPPADVAGGVAAFANKLRKAWELALFPPEVKFGQTPSDVLYHDGRMRVLHYRKPPTVAARDRPPILCVYALINKPYVMDLQPGRSVVETLLARGLDVYLIDWGTPNVLDQDLRIHDYVNGYVDAAVRATQREAGVERILVTHPQYSVNRASPEQQAEMARLGGYIGLFMYAAVPHFNNPDIDREEVLEIIRKVGPEKLVLSTDYGSMLNVPPVEGMKLYIRLLLALGVDREDIETMVKHNPAWLLGLDKDVEEI